MNKLSKLKDEDYQTILGVKKQTFDAMLEILERNYAEQHKKGGRHLSKLSLADKLAITFDWDISKSMVHKSIQWVEDTLTKSKEFSLPSKRILKDEKKAPVMVLMDVTECEIQRPKKTEKILQRKKEKTHVKSAGYSRCCK